MDFLKTLALPQPAEHFQLLLFIMNLIFIVFLPYFGFLLGSAALSVYYERKGRREGSAMALRFAEDLISLAMFSKSGVAFLALLPALALVFVFIQILQGTEAIAAGLMVFGFVCLLGGTVLLYAFKYTFRMGVLLERLKSEQKGSASRPEEAAAAELRHTIASNAEAHGRTGRWGLILLLASSFLVTGGVTIAVDPDLWGRVDTVVELLIIPQFIVRYLYLLSVAVGSAGIGSLFFLFVWEGGIEDASGEYFEFVRRIAYRLSAVSLAVQPVFLLGTVALMPPASLTGVVFGLSGLGLFLLFLSAHFVYAHARDGRPTYVSLATFVFGLALVAVFSKDQVAVRSATAVHAMDLSVSAERSVEELRAKLGITAQARTGEEIYTSICSACHLFDQKKIGPPYKEVLAKYTGKKDDLIRFVLNPVKVNPAYPNMPNQGLKPAEADSVVTFILAKAGLASPPVESAAK